MSIYPPGAIFCRTCGYCLYGLTVNRCPECGHEFAPSNPKTFRTRPRRARPRRLVFWGIILVLVLGTAYGGFLTWLYVGWRDEARARALKVGPGDEVKTKSIVSPALARLLVGDCRHWQERVDTVRVANRTLSVQDIASIAACRRLKDLRFWRVPLTREDLALFCGCRELEVLDLEYNGLTGRDAVPIGGLPRLRVLNLYGNYRLDDSALEAVGQLKELRVLDLDDAAITDAGLAHLTGLRNLEELRFYYCSTLTDAAVPSLSRLGGLKVLVLLGTATTAAGVDQLQKNLPQCDVLHL